MGDDTPTETDESAATEPTDARDERPDSADERDATQPTSDTTRPTSDATRQTGGGSATDTAERASRAARAAAQETDLSFAVIAAVAANGVIGADGEMPWHVPEDLAHFERTTTGHPVILGRRTYDSIVAQLGEPLPDRTSVVLSRSDRSFPDGAVHAENVSTAIRLAARDADERGVDRAYVAGGATVYEAFLPLADRLVLTELTESYAGDTRFPAWNRDAWTVADRDERDGFAFVTYERPDD